MCFSGGSSLVLLPLVLSGMLASGWMNPRPDAGWLDLRLWNSRLSYCRDTFHRGMPVWFGSLTVALAADRRQCLSERSSWGLSAVLLGRFWSQPVSGPGPQSQASTSTQQTLEDCSRSVFFGEGRIILISNMPHLLLKNIRRCEMSVWVITRVSVELLDFKSYEDSRGVSVLFTVVRPGRKMLCKYLFPDHLLNKQTDRFSVGRRGSVCSSKYSQDGGGCSIHWGQPVFVPKLLNDD